MPKLNKNSYYHQLLIKQYGVKEAQRIIERPHQTAYNLGQETVRKVAKYARLHLQTR